MLELPGVLTCGASQDEAIVKTQTLALQIGVTNRGHKLGSDTDFREHAALNEQVTSTLTPEAAISVAAIFSRLQPTQQVEMTAQLQRRALQLRRQLDRSVVQPSFAGSSRP